jgi:hypothetical protein
MKYIKTYENKFGEKSKVELMRSQKIKIFVDFIFDFITNAIKYSDDKYTNIEYSSDRRAGYLAYYFDYKVKYHTGSLFNIKDLDKDFMFQLDSNIKKEYVNKNWFQIPHNLANILFFINDTIKVYNDTDTFGQSIRYLSKIMKELTLENFEIYQNIELYNL